MLWKKNVAYRTEDGAPYGPSERNACCRQRLHKAVMKLVVERQSSAISEVITTGNPLVIAGPLPPFVSRCVMQTSGAIHAARTRTHILSLFEI